MTGLFGHPTGLAPHGFGARREAALVAEVVRQAPDDSVACLRVRPLQPPDSKATACHRRLSSALPARGLHQASLPEPSGVTG
jgi:hypothetical protein